MSQIKDGSYDRLSVLKAVTASTTLAAFLGEALTNNDVGVTIISDGNLHYSVDGTAADADNAKLPAEYTIVNGNKYLKDVRLFSAASQNVSIILFANNA